MEIIIDNWGYSILVIFSMASLCLVSFSANRQLKRPILAYGLLGLSGILPIILPIYLGMMFFKAKTTRLFIYLFLLPICLIFLNISASGFSKNIKFSDLYSGNITLDYSDNISIDGSFLKLHEEQYLVAKKFNIGGRKSISNHFYYEIVPTNRNTSQKVRFFVTDVEIFNGSTPSENLINHDRFDAHVTLLSNIDETIVKKIRSLLEPEQKLVFITEHSKSRFKSNQKIAKIGSGSFGLLSLILAILVFREIKVNRTKISSI